MSTSSRRSPPSRNDNSSKAPSSSSSSSGTGGPGIRQSDIKGKRRASPPLQSPNPGLAPVMESSYNDDDEGSTGSSPTSTGPEEEEEQLDEVDARSSNARNRTRRRGGGGDQAGGSDHDPFSRHAGDEEEHTFSGPAHYLPLIVAIVPPLGAVLHGRAEAWTDALILLLVAFYLYQVVRIPWELYYASRTRRINAAANVIASEEDNVSSTVLRRRQAASRELRQTELMSLLFCLVSPFVGSYLLIYIKSALSEPDRYINPFNIRLFVLASGVKPWLHFFKLVKARSLFLQNEIHYPIPTVSILMKKVKALEEDLDSLRALYATKADVKMLRDGVDAPLTALSKAVRRYERKEEYSRLSNEEKFQLLMQRQEDLLLEVESSAREMEQVKAQQDQMGSGMKALRYIFSGQRGVPESGSTGPYVWYEKGPFFYVFLPLIASNKVLDATGRLFHSLTHNIALTERTGLIEDGRNMHRTPGSSGMQQNLREY